MPDHDHAQLAIEARACHFLRNQLHIVDGWFLLQKSFHQSNATRIMAVLRRKSMSWKPGMCSIPAVRKDPLLMSDEPEVTSLIPSAVSLRVVGMFHCCSQLIPFGLQGVFDRFADICGEPALRSAHQGKLRNHPLPGANGFHAGKQTSQRISARLC